MWGGSWWIRHHGAGNLVSVRLTLFVKRWNSDAFDVEINENQSGDNNLSTGRDVEATVSVPNKEWALDF